MYQEINVGKLNAQGDFWLDMESCADTKAVEINLEDDNCKEIIRANLLNQFEFGNACC